MILSANLAFDYLSKCEFKENVLSIRYQDANVSVNLAFAYQRKSILSNLGTEGRSCYNLED